MDPIPADLVRLSRQMPGAVFCAKQPNGVYVAPEIDQAMRHLSRLGLHQLSGSNTPKTAWGKILLCYRGYGGPQYTTVVGARSWYFCAHEPNLRLDVDCELPGQGTSLWGPFIMAIAKVPEETPDFLEFDPDGQHFTRLAHEHLMLLC
ncbi:MAG: hypothetical protein WCG99_04725 [Candidatus Berkelbacteria bacterium]